MGWQGPWLQFDVAVHFGTLLAILLVFKNDIRGIIKEPFGQKARLVAVGTIPTAIAGLIVHWTAKEAFESSPLATSLLIVTGLYLWSSRIAGKGTKPPSRTSYLDAFLIGCSQALAILPGLSRSGLTIVTGLHLGLERPWAGEFSFLLALPALVGSALLELPHVSWAGEGPILLWGAAAAFLSGYLSLRILLGLVKKGKLHFFAPYCWTAGGLLLLYKLLG